MADKYQSFEELKLQEEEGKDFKIEIEDRASPLCVIAIHGGKIEQGTTEIAKKISGQAHSFYSFEGIKATHNSSLHITSRHFDEPQCCGLVSHSQKVVSVHGKAGLESFVMLGGMDDEWIEKTKESLSGIGINILPPSESVMGDSERNICNRCVSGKGLQLEISRGLRDQLLMDDELLERFCRAIPV